VRLRAGLDAGAKLAVCLARDVEQWTERPGREQRIARRPEDPNRTVESLAEAAEQRGLSDPGLAPDEDELPA